MYKVYIYICNIDRVNSAICKNKRDDVICCSIWENISNNLCISLVYKPLFLWTCRFLPEYFSLFDLEITVTYTTFKIDIKKC